MSSKIRFFALSLVMSLSSPPWTDSYKDSNHTCLANSAAHVRSQTNISSPNWATKWDPRRTVDVSHIVSLGGHSFTYRSTQWDLQGDKSLRQVLKLRVMVVGSSVGGSGCWMYAVCRQSINVMSWAYQGVFRYIPAFLMCEIGRKWVWQAALTAAEPSYTQADKPPNQGGFSVLNATLLSVYVQAAVSNSRRWMDKTCMDTWAGCGIWKLLKREYLRTRIMDC